MNIDQKIIIVTHEMFYGVPHALRDYLLNKKIKRVTFIGHPLIDQMIDQRKSSVVVYEKGKQVSKKDVTRSIYSISSYIFDFFLTAYWIIKQREKYDIFIGIDALNSLSGLILRKIGKVEKVIFFAMDFHPSRFNNRLLNFLYHKLEEVSLKSSDEIWNVSPKIAEGRERFLHISQKAYPQKVVNSGIWNDKVKKFPFDKVKKHQLLFLGHLLEKQGLQMVLEATPLIVKKIPDFKFMVLGGGEYENNLKKLAEELKIQKYIEFKGWIKDRKIIDTTLGESAAAIVVYVPEKEKIYNFSYYGDPIKIKEYLASGLPVILTDVPHNAKEIGMRKCGIVVSYKKEEIANAVIKILGNEEELKDYRNNALAYAKEFDWNVIFSKVLN